MTATDSSELSGMVFEIQRMSTEDGPGLRTTVFLKGCSLSCVWCHNPESISFKQQVHWLESRCIRCASCGDVCPEHALHLADTKTEGFSVSIDRAQCRGCGICVSECPATALEMIGREWKVGDLFREVVKDEAFFISSGGGVTLGGGESTLQADFAVGLLKLLKERNIHRALDTCGNTPWKNIEKILPWTDLVLYDLKLMDPEKHKKYTGADNALIYDNLLRISDSIQTHGRKEGPEGLWIRTPVIPGVTDSCAEISAIGKFLADNISFEKWELLAFNNLCKDKYRRLGKNWEFVDAELVTKEKMEELVHCARESGVPSEQVFWSGGVRRKK